MSYLPIISASNDALAILRYLALVIVDGDWANDWLTHITDPELQSAVLTIGQWLATLFS